MTTRTRSWDGGECLRSIGITFSSGRREEKGDSGEESVEVLQTYAVTLESGEHIVDMKMNSGWMIDSILVYIGAIKSGQLVTRRCGPYGGDGGSTRDTKHPKLVK